MNKLTRLVESIVEAKVSNALEQNQVLLFCEHNNINYESLNEDQIEEIRGFLKKIGRTGRAIGVAGALGATALGLGGAFGGGNDAPQAGPQHNIQTLRQMQKDKRPAHAQQAMDRLEAHKKSLGGKTGTFKVSHDMDTGDKTVEKVTKPIKKPVPVKKPGSSGAGGQGYAG